MPFFDRMSLRLRILTLACIPLLALVAAIATTATIRSRADEAAAQAERSAKASHLARDLGAASQVVNLEARAMLLDRKTGAGASLKARVAELTQGLDRLAQSPDIGGDAAALKSEAALLSERLNTVIAMHAAIFDKDGAAATVTALGSSIEQFLQQALNRYDGAEIYQITIAILRMRSAGQQFMTQKTPSLITDFQENAAALANALPHAQMTPNDIRTLRALSADYLAAFQRWVDASHDLDQYDSQLAQASQTLTADLARLAALASVNEQAAQQRAEEARAFARRLEMWLIAIAVALTAGAALLLTRSISNALNDVRHSMTQIKNAEQNVAIAGLDRKDEIGEMARALAVFRDHAAERQSAVSARIARAQQREELFAEREQRVVLFENAFSGELGNFQRAVRELTETADALAGLSANFSASARNANQAVGGATEDVTSVAIATEQLSYSVGEVSSRTERSRASAIAMADTIETAAAIMERLNDSANQIGDVIGLIQRVAAQTNLLSLNATIEAARAGEAGRGFAVVAQEVKGLAAQTERATSDVRALIEQLRAVALEARQAFDTVSQSIAAVVDNAVGIAAAITEQKQGIDEINRNLQSVSSRSRVGSEAMQELLGQVEHAAESAKFIQSVAESIDGGAASLNDEVGKFLTSVRAA